METRTQTRKEPTFWRLKWCPRKRALSGAAAPSLNYRMVLATAWRARLSLNRAVAATAASGEALAVALAVARSHLQCRGQACLRECWDMSLRPCLRCRLWRPTLGMQSSAWNRWRQPVRWAACFLASQFGGGG